MIRFRLIVPALLAAGLGFGCASSVKTPPQQAADDNSRQNDMVRGLAEQTDKNSAWIRIAESELADIRGKLQTIRASVDSAFFSGNKAVEGIRGDVQSLAARVERLETPGSAMKPAAQKPAATAAFRPAGYNVEAAYNDALALYKARKFEAAISAFTEIATVAPSSSLADNAQYWVGESYFSMRNYEKSLQAFTRVYEFPNSNKAADAHLKIAMIYQVMENRSAAAEELKLVVRDYPNSEAAKIAAAKLQALGQ
jgi:tol-pal system protein YbgF